MAVYKIFPIQDATIYSEQPTLNTGLDAILELSKTVSSLNPSQSAADRVLLKFSDADINNVFNNHIGSASYSASLKLYLATAKNIPTDYTVEVHPLYESWVMGTGRFGELPINTTGVSWVNKSPGNNWVTSSYALGTTGSYVSASVGGGSWYTASTSTQSFSSYTDKDVEIDVTSIISGYRASSYANNGFILKTSGSLEFDKNYNYTLQYFSRDTNTIYPPSLELKWDDSVFGTGITPVSNSDVNVRVHTDTITYNKDAIHNVRISVRDRFPVRTFTTSSLYTSHKYLPSSSYWSLIDHKTEDVVIGFDESATKISADSIGNYFSLYMNGLEPARYYRILIKSIIGSETVVFDNDYIFKVE